MPARRIKIAGNIQPSTDERGPHLLLYAIEKVSAVSDREKLEDMGAVPSRRKEFHDGERKN
jgi:hypothetical protein